MARSFQFLVSAPGISARGGKRGAASRAFPGRQLDASHARAREGRRALEDLARAIGADVEDRGGVRRFVLREDDGAQLKRRHLEAAGVRVEALAADFAAGRATSLKMPADEVPLPLDARAWARIVEGADRDPNNLLPALVADRRASLLYWGLMSLDAPTRAFVATHQSLLDARGFYYNLYLSQFKGQEI